MKRWIVSTCLALLLPAAALGQEWEDYDYENLQFRGLGADVGAVWPASVEPTFSLGLRADMGFVGPHVRIVPAIRYWSSSLREREVERLVDQIRRLCERQATGSCPAFALGDIKRSDLELSADAHYLFDTGYTLQPYVGGGLGLHLLNGRGEAIDGTFVEDLLDSVSPGLNLLGGVNIPLGSAFQLVGEARVVLVSDVRYAGVQIGGTWAFPSPPANPFRSSAGGVR